MKKNILFLASIIITIILYIKPVYAQTASFTVSVDSDSITTGDTVEVSIDVDAENSIKQVKGVILYNSDMLEFKGADSDLSLEKDGIINIEDKSKSGGRLRNYMIKFNTIKPGISKITFKTVPEVTDTDGSKLTCSYTPEYVEVEGVEVKDSDATLKELYISPGSLDKEFKKNVKSYKATIQFYSKNIVIDAITTSKKAEVNVEGNKDFKVGNNKVKIKVVAEDGSDYVYSITVKRMSEEEQLQADMENHRKLRKENGTIYTDGKTMHIVNDNDYEILSIIETESMKIPVGYKKTKISLYGNDIEACVLEDDPKNDIFLIYLKNTVSGDEGYYQYDKVEKTLQRYMGDTVAIGSEKSKQTFANNEYNDKLRILGIIIGVLAALLIISIGFAIKMAIEVRTIKNDNYLI